MSSGNSGLEEEKARQIGLRMRYRFLKKGMGFDVLKKSYCLNAKKIAAFRKLC